MPNAAPKASNAGAELPLDGRYKRTDTVIQPQSPSTASPPPLPLPLPLPIAAPQAPVDVTIAEIRDQGLKVLLRSRLPLCYFLRFLLEEHSCENLICYLEIDHYESQQYSTPHEQQTAALQILDVYLSPRSPFEVNVTERAHAQCHAAVVSEDATRIASCFTIIRPAIFQLLLDAYMRFTRSDWWRRLVTELDGKATYTVEDRNATVSHLIGYLDQLHRHDLVHAPDRAALFRELIADFCRTVVGIEIITQLSPSTSKSSGTLGSVTPPARNSLSGYTDDEAATAATRKTKSNPLAKLKSGFRRRG